MGYANAKLASQRGIRGKMKAKLTTFILLTMLIVSQAFATNLMPCESMTHDMSPKMQHADMQHKMSQSTAMDCCDQDCACPIGACANIALMSSVVRGLVQTSSVKVLLPISNVSAPFQTLFNKPPIYS